MSRILVTGANGQVGRELLQALAPLGEVIAGDRTLLDLTCLAQIRQTIGEMQPDVIVNAAAYTAVDQAESHVELANAINGTAPRTLAELAKASGATLIHLSTDYVFDGTKQTPYLENDLPHPIGAYAQSKRLGEVGIQGVFGIAPGYIILRTAWIYGVYGQTNFVKTMLRLGAERQEIKVVADQIGSPTWARDLATAIAGFTEQSLSTTTQPASSLDTFLMPPTGIYHFTNAGVASWYDFAVAIFAQARSLGFPLTVQRVIPISTAEYPTLAQRPAYSVLSGHKTAALLGSDPPPWQQGLQQMLTDLYSNTYESHCSVGR